jgi:hypothetical protein
MRYGQHRTLYLTGDNRSPVSILWKKQSGKQKPGLIGCFKTVPGEIIAINATIGIIYPLNQI